MNENRILINNVQRRKKRRVESIFFVGVGSVGLGNYWTVWGANIL